MKAIILAGGMGTRLRSVVADVPKPMAPVGGKPFLEYLLLQLKRWEIPEVVLSVGYKKDLIKSCFGDGHQFGISISYSEESRPLGTGGALKQAVSLYDDPYFIVMNGDSFFGINFSDLITHHESNPGIVTMGLASVKDKGRYGSVEINRDGSILSFHKKGTHGPGWINGGIYCMDRRIVDYIPEGQVSLEGEVLPLLKADDLLYGKSFDAFFLDMGIPEDYHWIDNHAEHLTEHFQTSDCLQQSR